MNTRLLSATAVQPAGAPVTYGMRTQQFATPFSISPEPFRHSRQRLHSPAAPLFAVFAYHPTRVPHTADRKQSP
jgi:hypothetical protein